MKHHLIVLYVTDSTGGTYTDYHIVQATDEKEADITAHKMAQLILEKEHFDSKKHNYEYKGKYADCYGYAVGAIE